MMRLIVAGFLLLPGVVRADATCAEIQAAFRVPPPPSGVSEDPGGPLGCSREALQMFIYNINAVAEAEPVGDLSDLHGVWLGDLVLQFVVGAVVPGQELLVFAPGKEPGTLEVRQYWMKAVAPAANPLWSEDGEYLGLMAEAVLERDPGGAFVVPRFDEQPVRYSGLQLEFQRSHDLEVKTKMNHFELPLELRLAGDVLVLEGALRDPASRKQLDYVQTYTRVAPGAAELALGVVAVFELSQSRNFDCLTHQISDGEGPFVDALGDDGMDGVKRLVFRFIAEGMRRERLAREMRAAVDEETRDRMRQEMKDFMEGFIGFTSSDEVRGAMQRIAEASDGFCPSIR
ncbi:hypothetical protein ACTXGA_06530 [Antarctobacter jejuensis]